MQPAGTKAEVGAAERCREDGRKIREAMAEKARRGEPSGPLPLGYRYEWEGLKKKTTLNPEKAPLVRQAFLMAAAGYPIRKVIKEMAIQGLVSRHGKPIGPSSMLKVLRNTFYSDGRPALIDPTTFRLAQKGLAKRRKRRA